MSDNAVKDDIRETLGAPTLLESAREAQRRTGQAPTAGDQTTQQQDQFTVRNLNPGSIGEKEGGKKRERQVTQPQGMVQDEEGVDSTRDAASFLGKKLFGERLSGRVNEKGQQEEGKSGDAYDGNNGKGSDKGKKSAQDQASEAGQEGNGEQGKQNVGDGGPRVTKTLKQAPPLTKDDIATVVKATIEGTRAAESGESGRVHDDPNKAAIDGLTSKEKRNFAVITKMAETYDHYKELPKQFLDFQQSKKEYAKAYKDEHGEAPDWEDEEHAKWISDNQPEFDEEDFVDSRIELRAEAVAEKRMEKLNTKLQETERRATEGTLKERMKETAKAEISAFTEAFSPDGEWDLTTPAGRKAAEESDPVIGGIAARWSEALEAATEKLVRLYDGGGLWKADMSDEVDRYLASLAQNWESALSQQDVESTKNKDGKLFASRSEYRKMSEEQKAKHWIIGREEMLWILPRDISEKAGIEKEEELDKLEKIAAARGWRFDRESLSTQKKKIRSNPDGIDEDGQRATVSSRQSPPSSTSGSKVNSDAGDRKAENKNFSELLANKLFGRQPSGSE